MSEKLKISHLPEHMQPNPAELQFGPETGAIDLRVAQERASYISDRAVEIGKIAFHGISGWVSEKLEERADTQADKLERRIAVDQHINKFVNGRAAGSTLDTTTLTRKERRRALAHRVKAADAEWDRETAERKESANGGRGRAPRSEKRRLRKQAENDALSGRISIKESGIRIESIKLGNENYVHGARPMRTVERAYRRADEADVRSLRVYDATPRREKVRQKRERAQKHRDRAVDHRSANEEIRIERARAQRQARTRGSRRHQQIP